MHLDRVNTARAGLRGIALPVAGLIAGIWLVGAGFSPAAAQKAAPKQGGRASQPRGAAPEGRGAGGGKITDEIAAVVGDTQIFRSEVEEQVQVVAEQAQVAPQDTAAYNELHRRVLDQLIGNQLLMLEAKAENITVTDQEVGEAVDQTIAGQVQQLGGPDNFRVELQKQGLTEDALRARYRTEARNQLMITKLVQKNIAPRITVADSTAQRLFNERKSELPKKPKRLWLQGLFILTRPDSVIVQRAHERALDLKKKIAGGMSFTEAARRFSDDPRGKEGGSMGRVGKGDLTPELEQAAFSLPVGKVSDPIPSPYGYHLIQVTGKDPGGQWVELSHILLAAAPTRSDQEIARERADEVHKQLLKGMVFDEGVKRFSEDPEAKKNGGDLGWLPANGFTPEIGAALDSLRSGQVSRPLETENGFYIFKLKGEQAESDYTYSDLQDQFKEMAQQQAVDRELQKWVVDLKKKFFVEVRASW